MATLVLASSASAKDPLDDFFTGKNPILSEQEKAAMQIVKKWESSSTKSKPVPGSNGDIQFIFGVQEASVICAPLQVSDIALQPGEEMNSISIGDSARWLIEPAVSGSNGQQVIHMLIKPTDVGLNTSLVVATDRRTYHIKLRSHRSKYMPKVSFIYPELLAAKWDLISKNKEEKKGLFPGRTKDTKNLSFNYEVKGSAPWKPVRVYNDGISTIIQMPKRMGQTEAPVLLIIRKSNSVFVKDKQVIVNNRLQGDRYIVDAVFDKAILIAGVGRSQQKITILRHQDEAEK
jgi:type IV secretion system protein VirB9